MAVIQLRGDGDLDHSDSHGVWLILGIVVKLELIGFPVKYERGQVMEDSQVIFARASE